VIVAPLLLAATVSAPAPPGRFVAGLGGLPRGLDGSLDAARAAGFGAMRIFFWWDKIETIEGAPDWACKYLTAADLGPDVDHDGVPDAWPGIPCDGTPCGCGYSADERVAMAAGLPLLITMVGTPAWARGRPADGCGVYTPPRAFPLKPAKAGAFVRFAEAVARRYGSVAYAFELWNEPDLEECFSWAGTIDQFKAQILPAAAAVKRTGVLPGLVVAPSLENPSGAAFDAWIDWSQPIDLFSFNLYTTTVAKALGKIEEMHAWCAAHRRCPGFYVTEFGARRDGVSNCPGPKAVRPGAADVAVMKRCRRRRDCAGIFLYALTDQSERQACDRGLVDVHGCRKGRLCTIARRFFGRTMASSCAGCGP
jgi:hypothetical protein